MFWEGVESIFLESRVNREKNQNSILRECKKERGCYDKNKLNNEFSLKEPLPLHTIHTNNQDSRNTGYY